MITKHDLKPGVKFKYNDDTLKIITSICKSRDIFSVDISYMYREDNQYKYDSVVIDKEDLDYIKLED
jgi:hypothetical protein